MGEASLHADNASASSEDSIKPPPRLDPSRIKPGPAALPANTFDPLKHHEWEHFWFTVDQHFQPINGDNLHNLQTIPVNPYGGHRDIDLRLPSYHEHHPTERKPESKAKKKNANNRSLAPSIKSEELKNSTVSKLIPDAVDINGDSKGLNEKMNSFLCSASSPDIAKHFATLNSFPVTHRLVAALLDESPSGTSAPPPIVSRSSRANNATDEALWMGIGTEPEIRAYQTALEDRVKVELSDVGLLDLDEDEAMQAMERKEHWKLRDIKTINRIKKGILCNRVVATELRQQAINREIKRHFDQVEMVYLQRMVRNMKKNKKSRSKFQKLLQKMFGHYKEMDKAVEKGKKAAETLSSGRLLTNGEEKARPSAKKRKKKSDAKGPTRAIVGNGKMSPG